MGAIAIGIALCVAGYIYIFKAIHEQLQIQYEINLKLRPDQRFEPTFWSYGTHERFRQLERELLPESPRPQKLRKFRSIGVALLFSGMLILFAGWSVFHK